MIHYTRPEPEHKKAFIVFIALIATAAILIVFVL